MARQRTHVLKVLDRPQSPLFVPCGSQFAADEAQLNKWGWVEAELSKLEFHDKMTLLFSRSVNKKNEKSSSNSAESKKRNILASVQFQVLVSRNTLANKFGGTHLEAGVVAGSALLLGGFAGWAQALRPCTPACMH